MKAVLEFDLPEDHDAFATCIAAADYLSVLRELAEWFRAERKYHDRPHDAEAEFYRVLEDHWVDLT